MFYFFIMSLKHLEGWHTYDVSVSYVVSIRVIVAFAGKKQRNWWAFCNFILYVSASEKLQGMKHILQAHFACCVNTILKEWRSDAGILWTALSIKEPFPLSAFSICQGSESEDAPVSPSPHRWITTLCFLSGHDLLLGNPGSQLYEESGASFFIY